MNENYYFLLINLNYVTRLSNGTFSQVEKQNDTFDQWVLVKWNI